MLFLSVPVCPHAGGVGLCELVQHLIIFDYISVSGSLKNRFVMSQFSCCNVAPVGGSKVLIFIVDAWGFCCLMKAYIYSHSL